MRIEGSSWFYIAAGAALLYVVFRGTKAAEAVVDGVGRFWDGLTFDRADLGPDAALTDAAATSEQDWIDLGYLERLTDGRTRITPAGEAYIAAQQAAQGGYRIVGE